MKTLCFLALLMLSGCAFVHSTTVKTTDPRTGGLSERTHATAYTLFDANTQLAKFRNTTGGTNWAPGTYIGSLNESSSSTNLNTLIQAIVAGAVQGAVTAAK